ncbi:hypothetical protein K461DRAFT_297739 [Myriangium duriaei CBS 260.36]|uniref:Uncharacterized protein n=1 Tax=Myriangium duriaei CBS 260.36 TaxID=1168546 RepID=A0A9P4ITN9_9PEZI|nr:hypothetical protein K461DRAFT_297739 [Myriangium duriaei CBS 260.36]
MATLDIPSGGLSLRGWPLQPYKPSAKSSSIKRSAILLKINKQVIRDLQQCAKSGEAVKLLGGQAPRIQYGSKSIDLSVESEKFTHEVYAQSEKADTLEFAAAVTQRASVSITEKAQHDTAGADAALNNLKQSLASHAQDKESKLATISSSVIPSTKSNKILANRYVSTTSRGASQGSSPLHGSTKTAQGPTSAPLMDPAVLAQNKAMTYALSHLLSSGSLLDDVIATRTHIPQQKRHEILQKVAEEDRVSKKWTLKDRSYKDLDVWKFKFPNDEDRDAAIDNAIRAFDRTRLSKDDKLWQMLLPESERGKGRCLSRLHNNIHLATTKEKSSHGGASSPPGVSDHEAAVTNVGRLTPQAGSTPMTRTASSTGKGMSIEKRLKESQKQRAAEEAKEAKRKVKESKSTPAAALEKPRILHTRQLSKTSTSKIKSEATVHSSDDESDSEMRKLITAKQRNSMLASPNDARSPPGNSSSEGRPLKAGSAINDTRRPTPGKLLASPNAASKRSGIQKAANAKGDATPTPSNNTLKVNPDSRKPTPSQRAEKRPPATSGASPNKVGAGARVAETKTKTPSPPGRLGSNGTPSLFGNYDHPKQIVKKVVPAAVTKGHKASNSVTSVGRPSEPKKRPANQTSDDSERPRKTVKTSPHPEARRENAPAAKKSNPGPPRNPNGDGTLKRKANDISSGTHDHHDGGPIKHRRTESSSAQSMTFSSSSANSHTTTARTSVASPSPPAHQAWLARSPSVTSSASEATKLGWERALEDAERFNKLYPQYEAMYKRIQGMKATEVRREDTERLWKLHDRLKLMKREITTAANA